MIIFNIIPDVDRYKQLAYDEKEFELRYDDLKFRGEPKSDTWSPLSVEWIEDRPSSSLHREPYVTPDIAYIDGDLAFNSKATSILKPFFTEEAEFLPIKVKNEEWAILNIINIEDALDKANCRHKIRSDGTVGRMIAIAIDKNRVENSKLFRLNMRGLKKFTSDTPGSFKEVVEKNGLTGLKFEEV